MATSLSPNFERKPSLADIVEKYRSAREAFERGNYYVSLIKAQKEDDSNIEAASMVMCGSRVKSVEKALKKGSVEYLFAKWCYENTKINTHLLSKDPKFTTLANILRKRKINIFYFAGPHTETAIPQIDLPDISVASKIVKRDEIIISLKNVLPKNWIPDVIIILDIYGYRLPNDLYTSKIPLIFVPYDFDFQLQRQFEDLNRASLIVSNSAYEHILLEGIYGGPISAYPTFVALSQQLEANKHIPKKDIDFFHSGVSFNPLMREKAQFLFRIATIDNPKLKIIINEEFLPKFEYQSYMQRAKFIPIMSSRNHGGMLSRSMDSLSSYTFPLHGVRDAPIQLFNILKSYITLSSHSTLEKDVFRSLLDFDEKWDNYKKSLEDIRSEISSTLLTSEDGKIKFLKFCIFEIFHRSAFKKKPNSKNDNLRANSIVGVKNSIKYARKNMSHRLYSLSIYNAIEQALRNSQPAATKDSIRAYYKEAKQKFPNSLAINFNFARYAWLINNTDEAVDIFTAIYREKESLMFEPETDLVWLRLFSALSELMPIQDYNIAVSKELADGRSECAAGKNIIISTCLVYLALNKLRQKEYKEGLKLLDKALHLYSEHFPAARLRIKTLYAIGTDWKKSANAFKKAIELYPPYLTELLPLGVSIKEKLGQEEEAVDLVKTWVYFITRYNSRKGNNHAILPDTWRAVKGYHKLLPEELLNALKDKFPKETQSFSN